MTNKKCLHLFRLKIAKPLLACEKPLFQRKSKCMNSMLKKLYGKKINFTLKEKNMPLSYRTKIHPFLNS